MHRGKMLTIQAEDGTTLYAGMLTALPLTEELIIRKSIQFFNDPVPCFIHRSAVMSRLYIDFEDALGGAVEPLPITALTKDAAEIMAGYPGAATVRLN